MRQWLCNVGAAVPAAVKEGDFFGSGGQQFSPGEEAVLVEIKAVLGL